MALCFFELTARFPTAWFQAEYFKARASIFVCIVLDYPESNNCWNLL